MLALLPLMLGVSLALHGERPAPLAQAEPPRFAPGMLRHLWPALTPKGRPWPTSAAADGWRRGRVVVSAPGARPGAYRVIGLDRQGKEMSDESFHATPSQVTVGGIGRRIVAVQYRPGAVAQICAEGNGKLRALRPDGELLNEARLILRSCRRIPAA